MIALPTVLLVPRPQVRLRWLLGYGFGFGTLQFLFLFVAMDVGMPTGLASLVLQASAPFTVVLGAVLLRERITPRQGVGIGLAVLGLAAIAVARAQSRGPAAGAADAGRRAGVGAGQPVQPAARSAGPTRCT